MEAVGALTYNVNYDLTTKKWTIAPTTGTVQLLPVTGTNGSGGTNTSALPSIGFTVDTSDAASVTGDTAIEFAGQIVPITDGRFAFYSVYVGVATKPEGTHLFSEQIEDVSDYQKPVSVSNYYGDGSDGNTVFSVNTSFTSTLDGDMIVKNFQNLTIDSGVTVTTTNRCKGMLIYCDGTATINGTLTTTARGANVDPVAAGVPAAGLRLVRFKAGETQTLASTNLLAGCGTAAVAAENYQPDIDGNGKIYTINRFGGTGGAFHCHSSSGGYAGSAGTSGAASQSSGGGGAGGANQNSGGSTACGGGGSQGTCFTGGSAGGSAYSQNSFPNATGGTAASYGGAGGGCQWTGGSANSASGGGGNPGGGACTHGYAGNVGNGGLLILIARSVVVGLSGSINCDGVDGPTVANTANDSTGGATGGGVLIILHASSYTNFGTVSVNGGSSYKTLVAAPGGDGGAGYLVVDAIDD
jgi:hypothetical protein